jgi:hypothetical protein
LIFSTAKTFARLIVRSLSQGAGDVSEGIGGLVRRVAEQADGKDPDSAW